MDHPPGARVVSLIIDLREHSKHPGLVPRAQCVTGENALRRVQKTKSKKRKQNPKKKDFESNRLRTAKEREYFFSTLTDRAAGSIPSIYAQPHWGNIACKGISPLAQSVRVEKNVREEGTGQPVPWEKVDREMRLILTDQR